MGQANIDRGEKWSKVRDLNEVLGNAADNLWLTSQVSIMADIAEFEEATGKVVEDVVEEKTKSKKDK